MRLSSNMPEDEDDQARKNRPKPNLRPATRVREFFENRIGPTGLLGVGRASSRVPPRSW